MRLTASKTCFAQDYSGSQQGQEKRNTRNQPHDVNPPGPLNAQWVWSERDSLPNVLDETPNEAELAWRTLAHRLAVESEKTSAFVEGDRRCVVVDNIEHE